MEEFFNSINCRCFINKNAGNIPWGQFALFYESLGPTAYRLPHTIYDVGYPGYLISEKAQSWLELQPLTSLVKRQINLLDLIKALPDMYFSLLEQGIQPALCIGGAKVTVKQYYQSRMLNNISDTTPNPQRGNDQPFKRTIHFEYQFNNINADQRQHILDYYRSKIPDIKVMADFGHALQLSQDVEYLLSDQPNIHTIGFVENIGGQKFCPIDVENYLPESASLYIILYCLGMLARYCPDIWMKAIDSNVQISETTNSLLNIAYRKFPNLILDQMTRILHYIHL